MIFINKQIYYLLFITIFLFCTSPNTLKSQSFYTPKDLKSYQKQKCMDLLKEVARIYIGPGKFCAGSGLLLAKHLRLLTIPESQIDHILTKINEINSMTTSRHSIFNALLKFKGMIDRNVFHCILNDSCSLASLAQNRIGIYITENINFNRSNQIQKTKKPVPSIPTGLIPKMQVIFISNPNFIRSSYLNWILAYYHERTHAMDLLRYHYWVLANQLKMNRGEMPDQLFQQHVTIINPGNLGTQQIVIRNAFYIVHTEANAYSVMAFLRQFITDDKINLWQEQLEAIQAILTIPKTRSFLLANHISLQNPSGLFKLAVKINNIMTKTIHSEGLPWP